MLDLAAPKVAVPATVLMIIFSMENTRQFAPLLVPIISWAVIKFGLKLSLTNTDIIVTALLTGLLAAAPIPIPDASIQIIIKGLLFLFIFSYLRITFPQYY